MVRASTREICTTRTILESGFRVPRSEISGPNNFQKASKNVPEIGANPYRMGKKVYQQKSTEFCRVLQRKCKHIYKLSDNLVCRTVVIYLCSVIPSLSLSKNGFSAGVRGLQAPVYKGLSKMCGISPLAGSWISRR